MKRLCITITFISLCSLLFFSCFYDNEEALYPLIETSCDTTNITFGGSIVTILYDNCYSCHSNKTASSYNTIPLEDWADVVANSVMISESIKHTGSITPMPKDGGKIKSCSIIRWDIWVRDGMPKN
jgi:hypothetical protein